MASPFSNDSGSGAISSKNITVLYQAPRKFSSAGEHPAVCMTEKFIIAVYPGYIRNGTLFYRLGTIVGGAKVEWQNENRIQLNGRCSFPSVAATSEGVILLAYVRNRSLCQYVVGNRVDTFVNWSGHSTLIDDGKNVSVDLHVEENTRTLTAVFAFVSAANRGYTRVGELEPIQQIIRWDGDKSEICNSSNFKEVSIAISPNQDNMIVVAYRLAPLMKIHCQVGKLDTSEIVNGRYIEFSAAKDDNLHGFYPSVTINKDGYIMMAYQSFIGRKLMCHSGIVQLGELSGEIIWKEEIADFVDYGCYPTVFLADSGVFIELHGTNLGASLYYRVGKLELLHN